MPPPPTKPMIGGDADVDVPVVDDEGNEVRDDLRDDGVDDRLQPVRAGGLQGFDRAGVNAFDGLGEQLAERGDGHHGQGQRSRETGQS